MGEEQYREAWKTMGGLQYEAQILVCTTPFILEPSF